MTDHVLVGRGREIRRLSPEHCAERLRFMGSDHHRVRCFVVEELARRSRPVSMDTITEALGIAPEVVSGIVDELERRLFFLVRNEYGEVTWAYPVTVARTPHRLTFSTGERLHGA